MSRVLKQHRPTNSQRTRLKNAAGDKGGLVMHAAVWTAVCKWSAANGDPLPETFAVSEIVANYRRLLAGQSKYIRRFRAMRIEASTVRTRWARHGSPGLIPAMRHMHAYLNKIRNTHP